MIRIILAFFALKIAGAQTVEEIVKELALSKEEVQITMEKDKSPEGVPDGTSGFIYLKKETKFRGATLHKGDTLHYRADSDFEGGPEFTIKLGMTSSRLDFDGVTCWRQATFFKNRLCTCEILEPLVAKSGLEIPETASVKFKNGSPAFVRMARKTKFKRLAGETKNGVLPAQQEGPVSDKIGEFKYEYRKWYALDGKNLVPSKGEHRYLCGPSDG